MTRFGRHWLGSIRLVLTICGLPHTGSVSGIRSSVFCSPDQSFRTGACVFNSAGNLYTTHIRTMPPSVSPHEKSRCPQYPGSGINRLRVPDDKVDWSRDWPEYTAVDYTSPVVMKRPIWADPNIDAFSPRFNVLDGAVDRTSFEGNYRVEQGRPLNPRGRTGLAGRGLLGRWGPNHAADPIVTRWKVDAKDKKVFHPVSKQPILQFVSIKRLDCGEWAIPGGMVDPGELVSLTLQREFSEEALNSLAATPSEKAKIHERITKLFSSPGFQVYKGYVDDPRNTDNAWIETVAMNFHDEEGTSVGGLPLQAGDDAGQVKWVDLDSAVPLYASHSQFLAVVANETRAHW